MNKFILSIVGKSGSGKTTLIKKLIPELVKRSYRVGTIKHTHHHDFEVDRPGKDSWEHQNAGATSVAVSSVSKFAFIKKIDREISVREIISRYFSNEDIILTEGFRNEGFPRIEVVRGERPIKSFTKHISNSGLLMVITDVPAELLVPVYSLQEVDKVADLIEDKMHDFYRNLNIKYLTSMVN